MNYTAIVDSPLGDLSLLSDGEALTGLAFPKWRHVPEGFREAERREDLPVFDETRRWLEIYFQGRDPGEAPPLRPDGTPFQRQVWAELQTVPWGETITYGAIAQRLETVTGRRQSARAVGGAVGRNPIGILIPCHRCVGTGGSLTGFGGGLDAKIALLELEGADMRRFRRPTRGTAL